MRKRILILVFFKTRTGSEPVKKWLDNLSDDDVNIIMSDVKKVIFGWPIGMPLTKKIKTNPKIWEVRSKISSRRISRVLFTIKGDKMILVHGFIKKTQQTPLKDIRLAEKRIKT
ncbi:MAG: type II toxin-antitoxin system RelE/ParE family toxin [Spirochaetaceae bacterium]